MAMLNQSTKLPQADRDLLNAQLKSAYSQFRTVSFENMGSGPAPGADFSTLPVSLAVAASASVPCLLGPVSFRIAGQEASHHIGDGWLFDNQGIESLIEVFLHKLSVQTAGEPRRRALIIMVDTSSPFDAAKEDLDKADSPLAVLLSDPFRIQGMMEQRALWDVLRAESASFVPNTQQLAIVHLQHTYAEWLCRLAAPVPVGIRTRRHQCADQGQAGPDSHFISAEVGVRCCAAAQGRPVSGGAECVPHHRISARWPRPRAAMICQ